MSSQIKPIETLYAGCRFRSRLEARWGVFFDTLGVPWEYEPQGFLVGEEQRPYLPDFWLPTLKIWFEVKGSRDSAGYDLWEAFCELADPEERCLLAYGDIPRHASSGWTPTDDSMLTYGDCHYCWCRCDRCGQVGAEFDGRIERLKCGCYAKEQSAGLDIRNYGDPALAAAYTAARSARFEHGDGCWSLEDTLGLRINTCLAQFDLSTHDGKIAALNKVIPLIIAAESGWDRQLMAARLFLMPLALPEDLISTTLHAFRPNDVD